MPFYPNGTPVFVPTTSPNSVGLGINALQDDTTGANNLAVGYNAGSQITTGANNVVVGPNVASTTLATGSNNILIGTTSATDAASASTSNTLVIGGGSTATLSATSINTTAPAVTIPGTLTVTGALTASAANLSGTFAGTVNGIGSTVGSVSTAYTNTGSTLATITGMALTLSPGTYMIDGYISCQCAATPGINLKFVQGSVGASTVLLDTWVYSTSTLTAQAAITALGSSLVNAAVAATAVFFGGTVIVSTAGTLTLQAAQSVSNATLLTIANGSYITAQRIA